MHNFIGLAKAMEITKETERFIEVYEFLRAQNPQKYPERGAKRIFADEIDVDEQTIGKIINRNRNASDSNLKALMDTFNVNANFLYRNDPQMFYTGPETIPKADAGIITVTIDEVGKENVLYVPVRAYASYIEAFTNPVHLKDMIAFKAPFLAYHGMRVFEVFGHSMTKPSGEGIHEGDSLWCTQVFKNHEIRNGYVHVVWTEQTGMVKRVSYDSGNNYITCRSDNPNDKTFRLALSDVREIWYVHVHFNFHMPPPSTIDDKLADLELRVTDTEKNYLNLINQLKLLSEGKPLTL